jgi:hypothetical protein
MAAEAKRALNRLGSGQQRTNASAVTNLLTRTVGDCCRLKVACAGYTAFPPVGRQVATRHSPKAGPWVGRTVCPLRLVRRRSRGRWIIGCATVAVASGRRRSCPRGRCGWSDVEEGCSVAHGLTVSAMSWVTAMGWSEIRTEAGDPSRMRAARARRRDGRPARSRSRRPWRTR